MFRLRRERRPDRRPRAEAPPPCEVHGVGFEHTCLACRRLKRDAIAVAIRAVSGLVGGAVSARSQQVWLRAVQAHPDFDVNRRDGRTHLLAVAEVVRWCAKRSLVDPAVWTSIPTRARIMALTGLSETTVKKWTAWLRERGFLATVTEGSTPRVRPGTRCGQDDDGAGNLGAEYALTIPVAMHRPRPCRTRPEAPQDTAGPALLGAPAPCPVEEKRPPSGVLSSERTPEVRSPIAGAREADAGQGGDSGGTAWTWSMSATPESKIDMLKAAQALRVRSPILRKITAKHLRSLLREHFRAGWTPADVLHALDHTPDGTAWTLTSDPRWLPGWIRYRLTPWRTPDGGITPSPSQRRAARHQAIAEARAAAAAERERLLARRVDAAAPAAAARAALTAASPKTAALIQQQDQRRTRLNFVKTDASHRAVSDPADDMQPPSVAPDTGSGEFGHSRRAQRPASQDSPGSITLREPEEVFQRVVDRHALSGRTPAGIEDPATVAADRAWLARVVATQTANQGRYSRSYGEPYSRSGVSGGGSTRSRNSS
ncbi:hypothetical protein ACBR40_45710 [Nonomuraea sp. AD125B]|uniref:hypothetical protein n=1 Tax=Nonomuraea sp. AD125B TaxID=3242897 RepID=UPI0035288D1D